MGPTYEIFFVNIFLFLKTPEQFPVLSFLLKKYFMLLWRTSGWPHAIFFSHNFSSQQPYDVGLAERP